MRKKLLLADDSITIQKVVELTFPTDEFEVVTAGNGRIAVDKAMTFLPDIVLCDVIMPQLDGYQVCEALRASADLKNVPILLLNGAFEPYDAAKAKAVGALGNVSKPFDPPALVARVKEILAEHSAPATDQPGMEAVAATGTEPESAEAPIEAPAEFEYDESETHPVSTVEVPLGVREMAARSMSLDAPVFATEEPEVLNTSEALDSDLEPSDFSETLHGPLDEGEGEGEGQGDGQAMAPVEELPAVDMPAPEPEPEEAVAASEELEPIAATGEFEAPVALAGAETEPAEFDADTAAPETDAAPIAAPAAETELEGEREFEPDELEAAATEAEAAATTEAPLAEPEPEAAEAEAEPMAVPEQSAPEPAFTAEPEPDSIGLPAPTPRAAEATAPADAFEAAAVPPGDAAVPAVPMDMVQQIAQRVISQVSERVIREIAWDVIPGLAEKLVKAEIERIKARAESERD